MSIIAPKEFICPFCGEEFTNGIQISCTIFGRNLDFKPFGAAAVPGPVPKCPKCHFVFFEGLFTKKDIDKLKGIFTTNNIFELEPDMPCYYYLAKEGELLNKNVDTIIHYYHSAIWENKNNNHIFTKITDILLGYFEKVDVSNKNYYNYMIIKLDFLRRRMEFEKAKQLINEINGDINFPFSKANKILLEYQEELIDKNDVDEHNWPGENKKDRERINLINTFFKDIKISISIEKSTVEKEFLEELSKKTSLKSAKIFNRINKHLPFMTGAIYNDKIYETLKYLRGKDVNPIITVSNKTTTKNITLSEWGVISSAYPDIFAIKEKIYGMFNP